jgi:hypothetical protein
LGLITYDYLHSAGCSHVAAMQRSRPAFTAVAIPARNESERIAACLEALDSQSCARLDAIVLLVNNSTDDTARIARSVRMQPQTSLHVLERTLPPEQATAGHARRQAMEAAAASVGPQGVLLTTDADGLVDPDWLAANLAALAAGADAVAGWVELHPIEWGQIPNALHEDDARECAYDALCDEIHGRLDPDPNDPMPRHTQHSGASIALTAQAYALCGGVPPIPCGEDRALIAALRRVDARIRHAPEVHLTVSGRTEGRSVGGMADTIRRRLTQPDAFIDDRLEPAADCARRAMCRAALRIAYDDPSRDILPLAAGLRIDPAILSLDLIEPYFGEAWERVERRSPVLARKRVAVAALAAETAAAESILGRLRLGLRLGDRSGTEAFEPEGLD